MRVVATEKALHFFDDKSMLEESAVPCFNDRDEWEVRVVF